MIMITKRISDVMLREFEIILVVSLICCEEKYLSKDFNYYMTQSVVTQCVCACLCCEVTCTCIYIHSYCTYRGYQDRISS